MIFHNGDSPDATTPEQSEPSNDETLDIERLMHSPSYRFSRYLIELEPGAALDHHEDLWQHAIVIVIAGKLHVNCSSGERGRFGEGDILTLARLPILQAHNGGPEPTRLLAICRATAATATSPTHPATTDHQPDTTR
jgi:quercetin dioxygenase-like cupin family protein